MIDLWHLVEGFEIVFTKLRRFLQVLRFPPQVKLHGPTRDGSCRICNENNLDNVSYSELPLRRTPLGPLLLSVLERCPS